MSVDLSKVILYSPDNAFKNVNKYTGTLVLPTSLTAGQTSITSVSISLTDAPVFSQLFCFYKDIVDSIFSTGSAQWYAPNNAGYGGAAVHINAPLADVGYLNMTIYPTINGNTLTVNALLQNPYANGITIDALSVPFVFIEYTLAN